MPQIYYIASRPETIVSIVHVGRLPENLPTYILEKQLVLYQKSAEACQQNNQLRQFFLVSIEVPDQHQLTIVKDHSSRACIRLQADQINASWLKKIFVSNEATRKLGSRLFNDKCPLDIEVNAAFFATATVKISNQSLLPRTFFTTMPEPFTYIKKGDILGSRMQAIINTVNCVGVMGKGIALQVKKAYPEVFQDYEQRCNRREIKLGVPYFYRTGTGKIIINFPTKQHWKNNSKLSDIETGLKYLAQHIKQWGVVSLAVPPLGCGNGGLKWSEVKPLVIRHLSHIGIPIEIYEPFQEKISVNAAASSSPSVSSKEPNNKRAASVILVKTTEPQHKKQCIAAKDASSSPVIPTFKK